MTTAAISSVSFSHPRPKLAAPTTPRATAPIPALFGLGLAIPTATLMVLASSLIGPFIMFAIPLMLVFGCAFGPLHALVKGEL